MIKTNPEQMYTQKEISLLYGNKEFSGLIFIGDPHTNYTNPGNRIDNYLDNILEKIKQTINICNENNYLAIILGDLFHNLKNNEIQTEFLNKLIVVFKMFKYPPILLIGNHDIKEKFNISDKDAISVLENIGLFNFIKSNGLIGKIKVKYNDEKKVIAIGGTPFGYDVPTDLSPLVGLEGEAYASLLNMSNDEKLKKKEKILKKLRCDKIIWLTHQKFNFNQYNSVIDAVRNTKAINEIIGVDMVVNGDIHNKFEPVLVGNTLYFNPGNISRVKTDEMNNIPHVSLWQPTTELKNNIVDEIKLKTNIGTVSNNEKDKLIDIVLNYLPANEVFDLSFMEDENEAKEIQKINRSEFINNLFNKRYKHHSDNEFENLKMIKDDILGNNTNVYSEPTIQYLNKLFDEVANIILNRN